MGSCVNEEIDISDSEIKEYKEAVHKLLKFQNYKVRAPNGEFVCPFCVGEEKQGYYRLLEHAVRLAEGSTGSSKQRTNHSAMAKYLVFDLAEGPSQSGSKMQQDVLTLDQIEKKKRRLKSWEEDLIKREAALAEEKRKMDNLMREKNDIDLSHQHHVVEEDVTKDELLEAGKQLMKTRSAGKRKAAPAPKADKRNAKKAMKDKRNKPKHAFFVFMEEFRETFKKEHPNNKPISSVVLKAGEDKWNSLSRAEKAPYKAKAEKEKENEKVMNDRNKKQDSSDDEGSIEFDQDYACALGLNLN